jgi:hypothetical protein
VRDRNDQKTQLTQKQKEEELNTYSTPEVTILGKLEDLTQNVGTKGQDALSGSQIL